MQEIIEDHKASLASADRKDVIDEYLTEMNNGMEMSRFFSGKNLSLSCNYIFFSFKLILIGNFGPGPLHYPSSFGSVRVGGSTCKNATQ